MSITQGELDDLRAEQLKFMPNVATVKRRDFVGGEDVSVPNVVASNEPCRLTPGFGVWRQVADQYAGITAFTGTFKWDFDIKAGDELIDEESRTFQVRDVMIPKGYLTAVRALLDLVTD